MRMKLVNSYDRIKGDLEYRQAVPANQPHDNWDVVPIICRSTVMTNIKRAKTGLSMANSAKRSLDRSDSRSHNNGSLIMSQVFYVPQRPKLQPMNLPDTYAKEKNEKAPIKIQRNKKS
eukprot:CAMPEP_0170453844 /NCGR_PEP_ID=MMETSP0123-20130129/2299_1 /TAXON_ID=182087 /ORGANISM="Favella ehrenbergii, Strain Fehren 1" /LENGTH=117 /DNA_ID=CAMNT_0010716369 /DNA_START=913 /DNA_END=1266 /DNA_ORIENTATION=+